MEKELKDKKENMETEGASELNLDDLEQVTGGANPFAKYARVPNQQYDDNIRNKA